MAKNKPTHTVSLKDHETGYSGQVGIAYLDPETKVIAIYLNPGVHLTYEDTKNKSRTLRLFPTEVPENS